MFLSRAKELNHQLMAAKIKLEKITVDQAEEASKIAKLKCTLLAAESAVKTSTERNSMVSMQIAEMENERLSSAERENERLSGAERDQ